MFKVPFRSVHRGKGRAIYPGQTIHASVAFKNRKYKPKAKFRPKNDKLRWQELIARGPSGAFRESESWNNYLEMDLFDLEATHVSIELLSTPLSDTNTLQVLNRLGFLASLGEFSQTRLPTT